MELLAAGDADLEAVAILVNSAYRGESSRQGWTTEADYIDGLRTSANALREDLVATPGAVMLLHREAGELQGCVWLAPAHDEAWYLGMLTVRPDLQDRGIGRQLLAAAEDYAREHGGRRMRMVVVSIRDTLIAWYGRRGYRLTGETEPFPYGTRFGIAKRADLEFVVLEKGL